ncbi:unnamed protein product [Vitrella brassicaformis CCMP3155]|uniref:Uncharacterized protein n=1 Tax=Vitrella brassicaformis (strain CCMP3155) TaxID=1169540 RepID=A0A0G4F784_VITBC|nr:unnamed protein product [Vitrella brassicaformis CCMP3155]|eukprot:CEM07969.1 unnamed protein product [Vitrella brassicaformis CCMP3155]
MRTSDLSNVFRNQYSSDVSIQLLDGTTFSAQPNGQPELSDVSPGITLYDLQANFCYVVDELVTREQMHQAALRRRANGSDIEKADTEASTDNQQHTGDSGGWRGLYEAFRKTKRTLIEAGSPPDAIPEVLAGLAPTVVETPCGYAADEVPTSGASSPVSSTQSRPSDAHTAALTPLCHLTRVDWPRLSSYDNDSAALSVSAEAVHDACTGLSSSGAADAGD